MGKGIEALRIRLTGCGDELVGPVVDEVDAPTLLLIVGQAHPAQGLDAVGGCATFVFFARRYPHARTDHQVLFDGCGKIVQQVLELKDPRGVRRQEIARVGQQALDHLCIDVAAQPPGQGDPFHGQPQQRVVVAQSREQSLLLGQGHKTFEILLEFAGQQFAPQAGEKGSPGPVLLDRVPGVAWQVGHARGMVQVGADQQDLWQVDRLEDEQRGT
ncbi:hypothetical protein D3C80_1389320 [compost metagenome]